MTKLVGTINKNIDDIHKCIIDILTLKKNKNYIYKLFKNDNNLKHYEITRNKTPNWHKTSTFKNNNINKNIMYYQIILYKIDNIISFIEINGGIKIFNKIIKDLDIFNDWNYKHIKITVKNIKDSIHEYLQTNINNMFIKTEQPQDINLELKHLRGIYTDLCNNKKIPNTDKIIPYNKNDCMEGVKSSETKYNENVYNSNINKYELLDRKYYDKNKIELGDIYDKSKNYMVHNKKASASLRDLSLQIITGTIILKQKSIPNEIQNFINKYNININNFSYVFGIIMDKKISYMNQIAISVACEILHTHGINYYIDEIEYIN